MKTLFGILGLVLGSAVGEIEGALTGLMLGLLTGAQVNSRRRIEQLEQDLRAFRDAGQDVSTRSPATDSTRATVGSPVDSATPDDGWGSPDDVRREVLPPEDIVPAFSGEHRRQPETSAASSRDGPPPQAAIPEHPAVPPAPGLFEKAGLAIKGFFTSGNVVVKVGMIILFFGVSFLLKYAARHGFFPIELRLTGVAMLGIGLLIIGWRLRYGKRLYALVLQGGAVGILYLTVFSAARLYAVLPLGFVFAVMVGLVVFSCALAVVQNAHALAVFATVGGFLAPVLTSTGEGSHVALFSYYALLNAGILGIAWYKAWRSLNWFGFIFTFVIASLWGARYYQPQHLASTEPFLVLFFLFYIAIPVLYAHRQPPELKGLVDGTLVFGTPLVGFALQSAMMRDYEFGQAWSALAMAALYLGLARGLWNRQVAGMRMLTESFLALAVIFVSLAVPLAMDGHWTAAAWSLEGAGITWVSLRQRRLAGRLFGLLLQVGAGFAFMANIDLPHGYTPVFNSAFLGSIMISLAALFTGYQYYVCREHLRREEQNLDVVLMLWGLAWWFGAGVTELDQHFDRNNLTHVVLMYISASSALLFYTGRRFYWPATVWPPMALLPVMVMISGVIFVDPVYQHPFEYLGYLAWPLAFVVHYWLVRRAESLWPPKPVLVWHAVSLWLLMFLIAWLVTHVLVQHVSGMQNWEYIFQGIIPAIFVMLLLNYGRRLRWPVDAFPEAYLGAGLFPVIAYLGAWSLVLFSQANDPAPLPWMPVLNPHDIAVLFIFFNLFNWCWCSRQKIIPAVAELEADTLLLVLAGLGFLWLNSLLAHAVHFYAGVDWRIASLMRSDILQSAMSILWAVIALAMMVGATRVNKRKLWLAGGILLGVTIVKLFVVDLADSGTVTRIVSFLTVGGLMLVIGYFSPVPPKETG